MRDYSREYTEKQDGFAGSCEAYVIPTEKENLFNWLSKEGIRNIVWKIFYCIAT